jgi:hypothetical protein
MADTATINIPSATSIDEVIGNRTVDGVLDVVRIPIANLSAQIEAVRGPSYETRAALNIDLDWPENTEARVWGDPIVAQRGIYQKTGPVGELGWSRIGPLPETDITRTLRVPEDDYILEFPDRETRAGKVPIFDENGDPVVGPTAIDIQNAETNSATAQAARDEAIAARDAALGAAAGAETGTYDAIADAVAETTGIARDYLLIGGYLWRKKATEPTHDIKLEHRGSWYEPGGAELDPAQWEVTDGGTNVHTELQQVFSAVNQLNIPFNGHDRLYGIDGKITGPKNRIYLGVNFVDTNPNGTNNRTQFEVIGLPGANDWVYVEGKIDRAGDGTTGDSNGSHAFHFKDLERVEGHIYATGSNAGSVVRFLRVRGSRNLSIFVEDVFFYQDGSITDDVLQAVHFLDCQHIQASVFVRRGGYTDRSDADRYKFSRGVNVGGCSHMDLDLVISEFDQGLDVTGSAFSYANKFRGVITHCLSHGAKFSNSAAGHTVTGLHIFNCGGWGIVIPAPAAGQPGSTTDILVTGNFIWNINMSDYRPSDSAGVFVDNNSVAAGYPNRVTVTGNQIGCYTGAATYSVATSTDLELPSTDRLPLAVAQRVRLDETGSTDHFLVPYNNDDPFKFRLASRWIDAIDLYHGRTTQNDGNPAGSSDVAISVVDVSGLSGGTVTLQTGHLAKVYSVVSTTIIEVNAPILVSNNPGRVGYSGIEYINCGLAGVESVIVSALDDGDVTANASHIGTTLNKEAAAARTFTIGANNADGFAVGTKFWINNLASAGNITVHVDTDTLQRLDGTAATGDRTIAPSGWAEIEKQKPTLWTIKGQGIS